MSQTLTAIVTGAASPSGIGYATAKALAAHGITVLVTDRDGTIEVDSTKLSTRDGLKALAKQINDDGGQAEIGLVDVTDFDQIDALVKSAMDRFGRIDILVNNAGTTVGAGPFLKSTKADWEMSFRVNMLGQVAMCQAVIPHMQQTGGGAIVNVGSTASLGAASGSGAYAAMKHGVVALTKSIAAEFGSDGIRCNVVCPGYIDTEMHRSANERLASEQGLPLDELKRNRYSRVALRRAGHAAEIADAIVYLATDRSSFVTGIALPVAGGMPFGL